MSPWRAPSTTATSLAVALVLSAPAAAEDHGALERLLAAVASYAPSSQGVTAEELRRVCRADVLCAAERLVATGDGRVRLERRYHPDTDTIRWARTRASVDRLERLGDGAMLVVLSRFGRKVEPELQAALQQLTNGNRLLLDLRGNRGGDFGRMLRVAGIFTGARPEALFLIDGAGKHSVAIPGHGAPLPARDLTVLVGPRTASSGEILAALLRRYAGAQVLGARTAGKDHLTRVVPLDQDWRLLLPAERVEVPGEALAGGLRPDRPLPPMLAEGRSS